MAEELKAGLQRLDALRCLLELRLCCCACSRFHVTGFKLLLDRFLVLFTPKLLLSELLSKPRHRLIPLLEFTGALHQLVSEIGECRFVGFFGGLALGERSLNGRHLRTKSRLQIQTLGVLGL